MRNSPVREVLPAEAVQLVESGAVLLDTREPDEWNAGHLAGATLVRPAELHSQIASLAPDPSKTVVLYCRSGARSAIAQSLLLRAGFEDVINVEGGWTAWTRAGLPTERPQPAAAD